MTTPLPWDGPSFLADGVTVATLRALSYLHSDGVLWASAGRVNATRIRLWNDLQGDEDGLDDTRSRLAALNLLGLIQSRDDEARDLQFRLKDGVVAVVMTLKDCDVCKFTNQELTEAIADAKTSGGQWGNVCTEHFVSLDCTLGLGRGQILRAEDMKLHLYLPH